MSNEDLRAQLLKEIEEDVRLHFNETGMPMKLYILAQRYGKRAAKLGAKLDSLVRSHEGLIVRAKDNGGRLVVPKEEFRASFYEGPGLPDVGAQMYNFWNGHGVSS